MTCGNCRAPLPDDARFCPSCGIPVDDADLSAERRVVTVLFADLAGFTSIADGRDPEAVKVLLDECFEALVPVVDAHGGSVDKIIGDELMAVFGAPVAHEDDPTRAVDAALSLVATLDSLRPELILRIGINTGEVLVGRVGPSGSRTVTGDTVNTAHRLVGVAGPGEILVGDRTHQATRGAVRYELRDPYEIRGKRDPVHAYAVQGRRRTAGRPPEVGFPTRLVGRDDDLGRLLTSADESATGPATLFFQVVGAAGLGKTRLAVEMHRRVVRRRSTRVLWGRGRQYGPRDPWQPLGEALRPVFGLEHLADPEAAMEQLRTRVAELISSHREPNTIGLVRLAELLGVSDPPSPVAVASPMWARRHDEQAAVCRAVIEALARDRPLILVIDDAHVVDPQLLEFLAGLSSSGPLPVLIVLASRDDLSGRDELGSIELATVELEPLDRDASVDLIRAVLQAVHEHDLDEAVLGPAVEDRILEAAGGVPFLIEQIVQYLIDRKLLVSAEKRWEVAADFASVGLPDTVRAMIDARLDALPPEERRFLQNASVFGRIFFRDAAALLGGMERGDDIDRVVASLVDRGLLGEEIEDPLGDSTFRHAMLRDAVYQALPLAERATKHQRVADLLATVDGGGSSAVVEPLAHHAERAVALARELGDDVDPGLADQAFERLVSAAEAAMRRDADREAERWFQRAVEVGCSDPRRSAETTLAHASVLIDLRRFDRATEVIGGLLRDSAGVIEPEQAAEARTRLAVCLRLAGDLDGSAEEFERARGLWQELGDVSGEAFSLGLAGWAELVAGRPRAAQPKLLRALDLELETDQVRPVTLRSLGWCEFLLGENRAAREHLWNAAAGFTDAGDRAGVGWCFGILGFSLWLEGRVSQAREVAETLLAEIAEGMDPWNEGMVLTLLAATAVESGDVDAATDPIRRAQDLFSEIGDPWGSAMAAVVAGMSARMQGRYDVARSHLEAGLEVIAASTSVGEKARLLVELGSLELDAGNGDATIEHARVALDLVRSGAGDRDSELRSLVALGRERRQAGDPEGSLRFLEEAIDLGGGDVPTSAWRRACSHLAMVQASLGSIDQAREAADRALDGSYESVRTWTLAMRADAAVLAAQGDLDGALRSLRRILTRLDDRPLAFLRYVRSDVARIAGHEHHRAEEIS